jgi:hypothetical protein
MEAAKTPNAGIPFDDLVKAVRRMKKAEREAFLEDLLAATSPEYLESIREAREDYRAGRVRSHGEVFESRKSSAAAKPA